MRSVCEDVTHFGDTDSTAYVLHYMLDDVPIVTIEEALRLIIGTQFKRFNKDTMDWVNEVVEEKAHWFCFLIAKKNKKKTKKTAGVSIAKLQINGVLNKRHVSFCVIFSKTNDNPSPN